jgi:hypothetical protein
MGVGLGRLKTQNLKPKTQNLNLNFFEKSDKFADCKTHQAAYKPDNAVGKQNASS